MSLGASGFGAALLAFFIDRSDTDAQDKAAVDAYNNSVAYIYDTLWTVFGNRSYQYMKKIDKKKIQRRIYCRQIWKKDTKARTWYDKSRKNDFINKNYNGAYRKII